MTRLETAGNMLWRNLPIKTQRGKPNLSCSRNLLQIIKLTALLRVKKKCRKKKRRADKLATIKYEKLPQAGNEMHNELDKSDKNNSNNMEVEKSNMSEGMRGRRIQRWSTEYRDIVLAFRLVLLVDCQWAPFPAARRRISFDQVAAEWRVVCVNLCASTRNGARKA